MGQHLKGVLIDGQDMVAIELGQSPNMAIAGHQSAQDSELIEQVEGVRDPAAPCRSAEQSAERHARCGQGFGLFVEADEQPTRLEQGNQPVGGDRGGVGEKIIK